MEQAIETDRSSATSSPAQVLDDYVQAFNRGDEAGLAACFTKDGYILDGMAPHVWTGPSATVEWWRDALAESDHLGISDFRMSLGSLLHSEVKGDAAYIVAPATLDFKVKGQPITQTGALFTIAFRKEDDRWLIAAWAWSKGGGGGVDDVARSGA